MYVCDVGTAAPCGGSTCSPSTRLSPVLSHNNCADAAQHTLLHTQRRTLQSHTAAVCRHSSSVHVRVLLLVCRAHSRLSLLCVVFVSCSHRLSDMGTKGPRALKRGLSAQGLDDDVPGIPAVAMPVSVRSVEPHTRPKRVPR